MRRLARGTIACALAVVAPATASADLGAVASRVESQWKAAGAIVFRAPTRFLYEEETSTFVIPGETGDDVGCTTVALIGARGISFHAKVAGIEDDPLAEDPSSRAASAAGVLSMERCEGGVPLARLVVTVDAGRGAIETVVARSRGPMPAMRAVLPERTGGILPPPPDTGPLPALAPPARRLEQAEARARLASASIAPRATWDAGPDGSGEARVALEPGCHRIELFAPEPRASGPKRPRLDVDAELRSDDDDLLARDRTDAPDARLEACVGEATETTLVFAGAPSAAQVSASHAWWPLPSHLPDVWEADARGRAARALRARHVMDLPGDPIALYQGPAGVTPIPLALEPGACYLALAVTTHGHARGIGLRAVAEGRDATDERGGDDDAGAVAFCAHGARTARLDVDARGVSLAWGVAVYRVASGVWEASR